MILYRIVYVRVYIHPSAITHGQQKRPPVQFSIFSKLQTSIICFFFQPNTCDYHIMVGDFNPPGRHQSKTYQSLGVLIACMESLVKNEHMKPPAHLNTVENHPCDDILFYVSSKKMTAGKLTIYTSCSKQRQTEQTYACTYLL